MVQKTLVSGAFKPSSPLTGNDPSPNIFRGQNMILEGDYSTGVYYRAYEGSLDLAETIPTSALSGTIEFDPSTKVITGTGTLFLDELHIGQMIITTNGEVIVVGQLTTQTSFIADRLPWTTASGQAAERLPILGELNIKRFAMLRGNALHFDKGTILAVGQGVLYVNGQPLPGDSLTASRQVQVAVYDSATMTYDVQSLGFEEIPNVVNGDVSVLGSGGTKNQSLGYYSFKVGYYSDLTSGYGNPTPTLLSGGTDGYQLTAPNSQFVFDFTTDSGTRPAKATGYVIYASAYAGSSDISKTNAIQGGWFEVKRVAFTDLIAETLTFDYTDSELATLVSFDNDMPPDAEFLGTIDLYPFLVSTDGQGVDSTGRETTTSPGPFVSPAKPDNLDAYPATFKVPTGKGETIIGVVSAAGRFFVMTPNTLQAVTPTGLPAAPFTCRPFWRRGFVNPYNLIFVDDTLYGYSGKKLFRSTGTADEAQESYTFASDVEAQLAESSGGYVFIAHDPKNECICVFLSAIRQNDDGWWETDVYPWSLTKSIWLPKVVLTSTERDMVVSGVATVNNELCFIAGGRIPFSGFSPRQWFRPEELTSSGYGNGDPITTWVDHSIYATDGTGNFDGDGVHVTTPPTMVTSYLNGYPVANLDTFGVFVTSSFYGQFFELHLSSLGTSAQEMALVVKKASGTGVTEGGYGSWQISGTSQAAQYDVGGGNDIYDNFGSTALQYPGATGVDLSQWNVYQVYSDTNDWQCYLNGISKYSTASNTVSTGAVLLGKSLGPIYFHGWVAEYILWDRKLTDDERAATLEYLQQKYNL